MTASISRLLQDVLQVAGTAISRPGFDARDEIVILQARVRDIDERLIASDLTDRAASLMHFLRKHSLEEPSSQRAHDWLSLAGAALPMVRADAFVALEREKRPTP